MNRKRRHWVVDVAIAARDAAIARDRAQWGVLYPLVPAFQQITRAIADTFDALTPVFEQVGRNMAALGMVLGDPAPADPFERALWERRHRSTGPARDVVHEHRPRRHA